MPPDARRTPPPIQGQAVAPDRKTGGQTLICMFKVKIKMFLAPVGHFYNRLT